MIPYKWDTRPRNEKKTGKIRIFIADDHTILRDGLKLILKQDDTLEIVGESGDGKEALENIENLKPDLAILDIMMPTMNGLEVTRMIRKNNKDIKIVILTRQNTEMHVRMALRYSINGYILKNCTGNEFITALKNIIKGNIYLSPQIVTNFIHLAVKSPETGVGKSKNDILTCRESEVLQLVAEGKSNNEIAEILDISPRTVKVHRMNIMSRLNIHNIANLVRYAIKNGLIDVY